MIIVLAGTSEGREICSLLQENGWPALASVTSSWGKDLLEKHEFENIIQGNLSKESLMSLIRDVQADMVIDATHPFAFAISQDAMEAALQSGIEYLRLERPAAKLPDNPLVVRISALEQLEDHLHEGQKVFSTLGSKHLAAIFPMIKRKKAELIARVLPNSEVIRNCEELGLKPSQIIAIQGPFSEDLNLEMFRQYSADLVISKESGSPGGLETKVGAALGLEIPILIWSRPELIYPRCFDSSHAVIDYINEKEGERR